MLNNRKKITIGILDNFIWMLLVGLIIIGALMIPRFFSIDNAVNILYNSSSFGMMVLGMTFVLLLGKLDLSIESTYAFAAAIGILCMTRWFDMHPVLAIIVTLAVAFGVGYGNSLLTVNMGINPFLATLCTMIILRGFVLFLVPQGIFDIDSRYLSIGDDMLPGTKFPIVIFVFIGIYIFVHILLKRTPFGKNLIATGSNERSAYLSGINIRNVKIWAFILAGFFAGLGGYFMVGRMSAITNTMGDGAIMMVIAACILGGVSMNGGKGTPIGALGGIIFLTTIQNVLNMSGVNPFVIQAVQGFILLAAIVFDSFREKIYHRMMMSSYK